LLKAPYPDCEQFPFFRATDKKREENKNAKPTKTINRKQIIIAIKEWMEGPLTFSFSYYCF